MPSYVAITRHVATARQGCNSATRCVLQHGTLQQRGTFATEQHVACNSTAGCAVLWSASAAVSLRQRPPRFRTPRAPRSAPTPARPRRHVYPRRRAVAEPVAEGAGRHASAYVPTTTRRQPIRDSHMHACPPARQPPLSANRPSLCVCARVPARKHLLPPRVPVVDNLVHDGAHHLLACAHARVRAPATISACWCARAWGWYERRAYLEGHARCLVRPDNGRWCIQRRRPARVEQPRQHGALAAERKCPRGRRRRGTGKGGHGE
jgi:hypothetical protein